MRVRDHEAWFLTDGTDLHIIDQWTNRELFNTEQNKVATQTVEFSNSVR